MASLLFAGAAGEVTGSRHLLEINGKRLLLDCGMFQGHRKEAEAKNRKFLFDPKTVDAVIISHAHVDHCGVLPKLVADGFRGSVYMTPATEKLVEIILYDSARIQEGDAKFYNKRHPDEPISPNYDEADVDKALSRIKTISLGLVFEPISGVRAAFHEAGHILGSAVISLHWNEGGDAKQARSLLFSGDLGRPGTPIIRDPWKPTHSPDYLILESTYGDREHKPAQDAWLELGELLEATAARGGTTLIPSFAVGRTQELLFDIARLKKQGKLKDLKVFVDSPMASRVTKVFAATPELWDEEFNKLASSMNPFDASWVRHVETVIESQALNARREPSVIISASGMCESGRILHHLRNRLDDPRNTILLVGFQAEGTLGRRLADGQKQVLIYGERHDVKAEVQMLSSYSAHADWHETLAWLGAFEPAKRIFLVHGEPGAAFSLSQKIQKTLKANPEIPSLGERKALG